MAEFLVSYSISGKVLVTADSKEFAEAIVSQALPEKMVGMEGRYVSSTPLGPLARIDANGQPELDLGTPDAAGG